MLGVEISLDGAAGSVAEMAISLNLLIVESSDTEAEGLARVLRRAGQTPVWTRVDTATALAAALAAQPWDLVLANASLPGVEAPVVQQALAASTSDVPLLIVSAPEAEADAIAAMRAGARDYVIKTHLQRLPAIVEREWRDADLRRARRQLEGEGEARTRAILNTAVDGIIIIDECGIIDSFNPAAERIFGYRADEVVGRNVTVLMGPPYRDQHDEYLTRYRRTGEQRIIGIGREVVGCRKGGAPFPIDLAVSEVVLGDRRLYTGIVRDITERKQAEIKLRKLEQLAQQRERLADIGAIAAQIAHDLGNPLAGVSMQAQLILRRAARNAEQPLSTIVQPMERILAEVRRLDSLIKEFMEFSREQRLDLKRVELHGFLRRVGDLWEPVAAARRIALSVATPSGMPSLTADEEKLRRVMDNLVKNAIEAIDMGPGAVDIRADWDGNNVVRIAVSDTGPGIPESVQVFRLFETTKADGSGIGLAVTRQIVLAHRGSIDFVAREPRGTVFSIKLPCNGPVT